MVRTQILLTEAQTQALRRLSSERGVSMAVLIRDAVDTLLQTETAISADERRRRALRVVGQFASGKTDVSAKHDEYLEDAYRARDDVR